MTYELVAIGCSLGGLNAIRSLFTALPENYPAAVAIVQHRAADSTQLLTALLQKHSALALIEAEDKMGIEPGHAYLAPPDYHLLLDCGVQKAAGRISEIHLLQPAKDASHICCHFALSTDAPVNFARPSIDVFFESAAECYGEKLIGVLLTGASKDGSQGLAAIKQRGGLTVAQDPKTARARVMPAAAIALKAADYILPLKEIGSLIANFGMQT
ncbi:MAG: chemotaxis protein CheB [Anaerolinea sp.]|nr:chemotaxis protein CheB [Anaerolinea sp.]